MICCRAACHQAWPVRPTATAADQSSLTRQGELDAEALAARRAILHHWCSGEPHTQRQQVHGTGWAPKRHCQWHARWHLWQACAEPMECSCVGFAHWARAARSMASQSTGGTTGAGGTPSGAAGATGQRRLQRAPIAQPQRKKFSLSSSIAWAKRQDAQTGTWNVITTRAHTNRPYIVV